MSPEKIVEQVDITENINTIEKPLMRCERCDRETDEWVLYVHPDNRESIVCWSCQERDDKNYTMKDGWRQRERSGGRFLPNSPKD